MKNKLSMRVRYSITAPDSVKNISDEFLRKLQKRIAPKFTLIKENKDKLSVINLAFFPVVSRTGTDIDAALKQIANEETLAILVMLHHTFDPEAVVPDSNTFVKNEKILTLDCLFYEDIGLLKCDRNKKSYNKAGKWIQSQKSTLQKLKHQQRKNKSKACTIL